MREGYSKYIVIEQAEDIRQRIIAAWMTGENANTNDLGPEYWTVIWEIVTTRDLTTVAWGAWQRVSRMYLFRI